MLPFMKKLPTALTRRLCSRSEVEIVPKGRTFVSEGVDVPERVIIIAGTLHPKPTAPPASHPTPPFPSLLPFGACALAPTGSLSAYHGDVMMALLTNGDMFGGSTWPALVSLQAVAVTVLLKVPWHVYEECAMSAARSPDVAELMRELQQLPQLSHWPPLQFADVALVGKRLEVEDGRQLFAERESARRGEDELMYIVLGGELQETLSDEPAYNGRLSVGDMVGEAWASLAAGYRISTVTCNCDAVVLALDRKYQCTILPSDLVQQLENETRFRVACRTPPKLRSSTSVSLLVDMTRDVSMFKKMASSVHQELCKEMVHQYHPAGTWLFKQGEIGRSFFVVLRGKVSVWAKDKAGLERKVNTLRAGAYFGELALLFERPRAASVRLDRDCHFMELDKDIYETVLRSVVIGDMGGKLEFMSKLDIFASVRGPDWDSSNVTASQLTKFIPLSYYLFGKKVCRGQVLVQQGKQPEGRLLAPSTLPVSTPPVLIPPPLPLPPPFPLPQGCSLLSLATSRSRWCCGTPTCVQPPRSTRRPHPLMRLCCAEAVLAHLGRGDTGTARHVRRRVPRVQAVPNQRRGAPARHQPMDGRRSARSWQQDFDQATRGSSQRRRHIGLLRVRSQALRLRQAHARR